MSKFLTGSVYTKSVCVLANKDTLKTTIPAIHCGAKLFPHLRIEDLTTRWGEKHGGR